MDCKITYACDFCMGLVEGDRPNPCPHCKVVKCRTCLSYLKVIDGAGPKFCSGCGTVSPDCYSGYYSIHSTSGMYAEEEWCKRNRGKYSTGDYVIVSGYLEGEKPPDGKRGHWLAKAIVNRNYERVRFLTTEEEKLLVHPVVRG